MDEVITETVDTVETNIESKIEEEVVETTVEQEVKEEVKQITKEDANKLLESLGIKVIEEVKVEEKVDKEVDKEVEELDIEEELSLKQENEQLKAKLKQLDDAKKEERKKTIKSELELSLSKMNFDNKHVLEAISDYVHKIEEDKGVEVSKKWVNDMYKSFIQGSVVTEKTTPKLTGQSTKKEINQSVDYETFLTNEVQRIKLQIENPALYNQYLNRLNKK